MSLIFRFFNKLLTIMVSGRLYDKAGNKKKWWSQSTIDTYKTKAQCFVKQYDKYASTDINEKTVLVSIYYNNNFFFFFYKD